jgi:hypothetical protein
MSWYTALHVVDVLSDLNAIHRLYEVLYATANIESHVFVAFLVGMYITHVFNGPIVFFFVHVSGHAATVFAVDPTQSSSKQSSIVLAPTVVVRPAGHFVQFVEFSSAA